MPDRVPTPSYCHPPPFHLLPSYQSVLTSHGNMSYQHINICIKAGTCMHTDVYTHVYTHMHTHAHAFYFQERKKEKEELLWAHPKP